MTVPEFIVADGESVETPRGLIHPGEGITPADVGKARWRVLGNAGRIVRNPKAPPAGAINGMVSETVIDPQGGWKWKS